MLFLKASKIQVGKNITQQDEPTERVLLQHAGRGPRTAYLRAQMHVGKDQRVVDRRFHTNGYSPPMLQGYEKCTEISA